MTPSSIEGLYSILEGYHLDHHRLHQELTERLDAISKDVDNLQQYLKGNGRVTVVVEQQRLRFAGSLSLKALGLVGTTSTGGLVYLVGKALGQW